jgi:hypothetical protein
MAGLCFQPHFRSPRTSPVRQILSRRMKGSIVAWVGFALCAPAEVQSPAALGDHMILRQNCQVTLWDWASWGGALRPGIPRSSYCRAILN